MPSNAQRRAQAQRKLRRQLEKRAQRARQRRRRIVVGLIATLGVIVAGVYLLNSISPPASSETASTSTPPAPLTLPTVTKPLPKRPAPLANSATCDYRTNGAASAKEGITAPNGAAVSAEGTQSATIKANIGELKLTLDKSLAPCAVNSFISLANQGYYNGTSCHRIGTDGLQMLQCGDPTGQGTGGPGYVFDDEVWPDLSYGRGYLAMANAGTDQTGKGTNGSQFFIVYGNAELSPDYTVFGSVDEAGLKLIDDVAKGGHDGSFDPSPGGGKPNRPVTFESVTVS